MKLLSILAAVVAFSSFAQAEIIGCRAFDDGGEILAVYEAHSNDGNVEVTFQFDLDFETVLGVIGDDSGVPASDIEKIQGALEGHTLADGSNLDQFDEGSTIIVTAGNFTYKSGDDITVSVDGLSAGFHPQVLAAVKESIQGSVGAGKTCDSL